MRKKKKRSVKQRSLNPYTTHRAATIPNKKRQANRQKCRKNPGQAADD